MSDQTNPNTAPQATPLPPVRLITTGHTNDGTSIFTSDAVLPPFHPFGPQASSFTSFHTTPSLPASNASNTPLQTLSTSLPRAPAAGTYFCLTDFPPRYKAPMHRTLSVDYACVLAGEIVLRLDGGEEKVVRAGEVIVQGGVNHEWVNASDGFTRVLFVMVGSEAVVLDDGRRLEETVFKK
ncbi:hypothetical protein CSPX01_04505 [Colletotrichum filicis]|nr:hypothetical protein CSPX01_04505 [Colletotrichum filicis]